MNTSAGPRSASDRAREFREAFDASFALPLPPPPPALAAFVILRAGGGRVAVRRAEMRGLVRAENAVAPVPGRSPAFLGLAGLQGALFPVWRLASLLEGGVSCVAGPGGDVGWLVLAEAGAGSPCAFACEGFEKMVFVPDSALSPLSPEGRALLSWDGSLLPVVKLAALQEEILRRHPPAPLSPP